MPPYIRVIQGDGIVNESIKEILETIAAAGFSADNVAFGQGGGLLQQVDRDTLKFAMKCSAIEDSDGNIVEVYKDPVTDPGKKSKKGIVRLVKDGDNYYTVKQEEINGREEVLETVFFNGEIVKEYDFATVRENARL